MTKKGCDWILANNVATDKVFGNDQNHIYLIDQNTVQEWPIMDKKAVADALSEAIVEKMKTHKKEK